MNYNLDFAQDLLSKFAMTVRKTRGKILRFTDYTVSKSETERVYEYVTLPRSHMDHIRITARTDGNAVIMSIDAEIEPGFDSLESFLPERAISFELSDDLSPDAILANRHQGPYWMFPEFSDSFRSFRPQTQSFFVKNGDVHYHVMMLCGNNFYCECESGCLDISSGMTGLYRLSGDFLSVCSADDPFKAVNENYRSAHSLGAINVPLRDERQIPELFRGFGWCTWDAFRHEVTSAKIYEKLDEFKAKNVPVHWIIIDDGWSPVRDSKLAGFEADAEKFPEGLRACIDRIKNEYGVEYVGVWHAFNGYWMGIDPESELCIEWRDCLSENPAGLIFPSLDEEKAFRFWDAWHSYLACCGVDFVKVDNQSAWPRFIEGMMSTVEGTRHEHRAIERSIFKNFGGAVINCMGMDAENVLSRPKSALSRNSDDFFPDKERGFTDHLLQNVYNAVWHGQMYFCDFDMWWSDHESAVSSGVLRAISGSPIYVSDKIDGTKPEYILPTVEDDGTVMMCDTAAQPTLDCFYEDCRKDGRLQKVWNRSGDTFAAAIFNVSDGDSDGELRLDTIPGIDCGVEYLTYEYFTKSFRKVKVSDSIPIHLARDGVLAFSIYPIMCDEDGEYIMLGNTEKYVPIASVNRKRVSLSEMV